MSDPFFLLVITLISASFTFFGVIYSTRSKKNESENNELSKKMDRVWGMYKDMFEKFERRCSVLENQIEEYRERIVSYEREIACLKSLLEEQRISVEQYKIEKENAEAEVCSLEKRIFQLEKEIQGYKD